MSSKKCRFGFAALGVAWLLQGCAVVPGLNVGVDSTPEGYQIIPVTPKVISALSLDATKVEVATALKTLPAADPGRGPTEYLIGPGDVLQIIVWDHPELTNPIGATSRDPETAGQLVSADGTLSFPYVGALPAGGKTVQEVRSILVERLATVINSPQVDVRVVAFRAHRIQVTGEVAQPGVVTLNDTTKGLLQAITERGGLKPTASRRSAYLTRAGRSYRVDMAGLLSGGRPSINPLLQPGDIVHVPDSAEDQVFMLGSVARQGPVVLGEQRTTLIEALTKSEGLNGLSANDAGVLVFRRPVSADKPASIFLVDLSEADGLLLAGEFGLEPRDVVYVKATAFSKYNLVVNQLLPTISAIFQLDVLTDRRR
ncbi:MAG: polysaccharide biosynthesis/export family protein [Panacagrimonas sp.]